LTAADASYRSDETYSYDANGNRTNTGYSTSSDNRLTSDGIYTYTYDDEGNLKTRTKIGTNEVRTFTWDYRNRLVNVVDQVGATTTNNVSYTYDVMDRRIAKTTAGSSTQFVYDGDNVILEFNGTATPSVRYLQGPGVDQVLAQEKAGTTSWMLTDHLGTVRDLVNNSGSLVNHFTYDSFGKVLSAMPGGVDTRYKFTGRELDAETGLHYYRARYFDANVGRFIGQDPIGFSAGDSNLYRYVGNSSLNATDPSGLYTVGLHYVPLPGNKYHADIVVADGELKGSARAYGAGVGESNQTKRALLTIYASVTGFDAGIDDRTNFGNIVTDKKGAKINLKPHLTQQIFKSEDCCDSQTKVEQVKLEQSIRRGFQKIADAKIRYRVFSANSNSAAFTVLEKTMGFRPRPKVSSGSLSVPGWETSPYTGQRSSQARPIGYRYPDPNPYNPMTPPIGVPKIPIFW
jgi:RHS repeat-associated protein